eukprot:m.13884 g.13884  ORF g.13884 m.13884 type:complete len:169 (+) comp6991_c0_seq1:438-944(+)
MEDDEGAEQRAAVAQQMAAIRACWDALEELHGKGLALLKAATAGGVSRVLRQTADWLSDADAACENLANSMAALRTYFETAVPADLALKAIQKTRSRSMMDILCSAESISAAYQQNMAVKSLAMRDLSSSTPSQTLSTYALVWDVAPHLHSRECLAAFAVVDYTRPTA